jgi:HSP90 family molecular chaperone
MATQAQAYEFRAEVQQLLNILVHSLYTDREIFLRELISNASDAINRVQFEMLTNKNVVDAEVEPAIRVTADKENHTITLTDTGIGMNREDMVENLGTIAHSGAATFLNALKEQGNSSSDIIGQFGVGFYSVFMVADRVSVTSRSFRPEDSAWTWTSDGSNAYTIEPAEKTTRGTEIVIHLKEDAYEFADEWRLKSVIRKHSNYVSFPITVGEEVANAQTALWRRSPREVTQDEYRDFYKQLVVLDPDKPFITVHQVSDAPVQFYSLLFVPSKLDRGMFTAERLNGPKLYARKVLIQDKAADLLPEWLRFVEGVVDSEDLPLNISRETVQSNRVMQRLKTTITNKLISEMDALAEKEPERYVEFWNEYGRLIKEGVTTDATSREKLSNLLRFHSSRDPEGWVSLKQYVERMKEGQEDIYYLFGENLTTIAHSPHLDLFRSRDIEVLYFTDPIDSFMINALMTFDGKKLHNGADADLELPGDTEQEGEALSGDTLQSLIGRFTQVLGERVAEVRESKVLTNAPARLVSADKGFGADMERVYKMLDKDFQIPKRILEINPRHALIRNMSEMGESPVVDQVAEQLFENALLLEGIHPNPADMIPRIQALMEAATKRG